VIDAHLSRCAEEIDLNRSAKCVVGGAELNVE
jgi:hypothetical protein